MSLLFEITLDDGRVVKLSARETEAVYNELKEFFGQNKVTVQPVPHYIELTPVYAPPWKPPMSSDPIVTCTNGKQTGESLMDFVYSEDI